MKREHLPRPRRRRSTDEQAAPLEADPERGRRLKDRLDQLREAIDEALRGQENRP